MNQPGRVSEGRDIVPGPESGTGSLFFIGTATTLIRYGELTVLTDPSFLHQGQRAYLGHGLTAKRLTEPAMCGLFKSPLSEFRDAMTVRGLTDQVRYVERGDTVTLPRMSADASAEATGSP